MPRRVRLCTEVTSLLSLGPITIPSQHYATGLVKPTWSISDRGKLRTLGFLLGMLQPIYKSITKDSGSPPCTIQRLANPPLTIASSSHIGQVRIP